MPYYETFRRNGDDFVSVFDARDGSPAVAVAKAAKLAIAESDLIKLPEGLSLTYLDTILSENAIPNSEFEISAERAIGLRDVATQILDLDAVGKLPEPISPEERFQMGILLVEVPRPTITDSGALGL